MVFWSDLKGITVREGVKIRKILGDVVYGWSVLVALPCLV